MADERLQIILDARDNTRGAFASVKGGLASLRDEGERTAGGMSKLGGIVAGMAGGAGFALLTGAVGAVGGAFRSVKGDVIDMNATLETSKVSWGVLLGSSEAAEKQLKTLYSFAATTPFEFPEVEQASRLLQTFGGAALNTEKSLKLVGDIAAGVGQPFADVAMWTGRMYDAIKSGRPFGEAAARLQEMGAMSGETRARLEALQKEGADGAVIWAEFEKSMGRFGGMMDKQSKTFRGLASTLNDTKTQLLATAGASTFAISTRALGGLVGLLSDPRAATGAQAISDALGRLYERIGRGVGMLGAVVADFRTSLAALQGGDLLAFFDRAGATGNTLALAFFRIRNAVDEALLPALRLLRDTFAGPGGVDQSLSDAAPAFGLLDRAILAVAGTIAGALRGFQLLADAVVTVKQAASGDWAGQGDEGIPGFIRALGSATVRAVAFRGRVVDVFGDMRDVISEWSTEVRDAFALLRGNTDAATPFARLNVAVYSLGENLRALATFVRREAVPAFQFLRDNWFAISLVVGPLAGLLAGVALPILAITTAVKLLGVAWATNWQDIQAKTAAVVGWFEGTLLPALQGIGAFVTGTVLPTIQAGWDGIVSAFRDAAARIGPYFDTIRDVFRYLTGGDVAGGLEGLKGRFNDYAAALGRLLGDLLGQATVKLAELAGKFIEWVEPMIPPALEALGRFSARVVEFVATVLLPAAVKALAAFAEEFWKWVGPAIPPLIEKLGVLLERFSLWFVTTALPAIVEQLARWGLAFGAWVVTDAIPALARELPKILIAFAKWVVTDLLPSGARMLLGVGRDIIGGLIAGMQERVGDVTDFLARLVAQIPEPIRKALGIDTPAGTFQGEAGAVEPRQHGGPVSAGMKYLVGERGPELFVPRQAGMIVPNGGGMGDPVTVHNHFSGMQVSNGIGLEAVAQAAASGVQRGLRQGYGPGRVR